jgi:putative membrane protein
MKTLVLCVDRDDDFGVKAGLNSPFVGREENLRAAIGLGLKDAEDSDTNTLLAAISIYDEMVKKGMDVEIATLCGDMHVGYESDLVLSTQLETVLGTVKPDRVVLVSDGAEDEYIYPVVSSRVKVDSVRKVFVKQAPTVEGTYYILIKMLNDEKIRKRIVVPIGLALLIFGISALLDPIILLFQGSAEVSFTSMGLAMIWAVVGLYLIMFAYKAGDRAREWWRNTRTAVQEGSTMIPFAVLSVMIFLLGILYGLDAAYADPETEFLEMIVLFVGGFMWMCVFAYFTFQVGLFINDYLAKGILQYSYLVASVTIFALGFILQGALDATQVFFGFRDYDQAVIIMEIMAGFLLAVFGALLNTSLKGMDGNKKGSESGEKAETVE